MATEQTYDGRGIVELLLATGAVAQVHALYADDHYGDPQHEIGFSIRVWQPYGSTHLVPEADWNNDDGRAHNITTLSAHVLFDEAGAPKLDSLDYRGSDYVKEFGESRRAQKEREVADVEGRRARLAEQRQRARDQLERIAAEEAALGGSE